MRPHGGFWPDEFPKKILLGFHICNKWCPVVAGKRTTYPDLCLFFSGKKLEPYIYKSGFPPPKNRESKRARRCMARKLTGHSHDALVKHWNHQRSPLTEHDTVLIAGYRLIAWATYNSRLGLGSYLTFRVLRDLQSLIRTQETGPDRCTPTHEGFRLWRTQSTCCGLACILCQAERSHSLFSCSWFDWLNYF